MASVKGAEMTELEIVKRLMAKGAFEYKGYRYYMDFDGEAWVVFKVKLRSWGYSTSEAKRVCQITF